MADISGVCIDVDALASLPELCTGQDRTITSVFAGLGVVVADGCVRKWFAVATDGNESQGMGGNESQKSGVNLEVHCGVASWLSV